MKSTTEFIIKSPFQDHGNGKASCEIITKDAVSMKDFPHWDGRWVINEIKGSKAIGSKFWITELRFEEIKP